MKAYVTPNDSPPIMEDWKLQKSVRKSVEKSVRKSGMLFLVIGQKWTI